MIGILYICTGKYNLFWKDFFLSAEKFFLPTHEKRYFIFTDAPEIYGENNHNVKKIYQGSLGWPLNTLMRFDLFSRIAEELKDCDFLFFINANTRFLDFAYDDILPGEKNDGLVAALHPYFWDKNPYTFSYDRNRASKAYIEPGAGRHYYFGAFNGGESTAYLKLIETLKNNIETDLKKDIIALWHDESHLNRYLLHKNPLVLSPAYCYPEEYVLPFIPIMQILDKTKYGGHDFLRGLPQVSV